MATEPCCPADARRARPRGPLTGAELAPALAAAALPAGQRRRRAGRRGRRARPALGRPGRAARRRRGLGRPDRRAAAAHRARWTSAACSSWPAGSRTTCAPRWPRTRRGGDRRPGARDRPGPRRWRSDGPRRADRRPGTRIVVCCGSGGVGKTTTAAALALRAAEAGRTVVVLTIDPARRLAQSLGLAELDNEPRRVDVAGADGELHAMMLDMKRTFDDIVAAHSTPERAEADLRQPLLPGAVVLVLRHAGVHGDGEAGAAAGQRPVGPDHRRHPAVAVGAGLPRRPEPDEPLPRRHDDPAADRAQPGRAVKFASAGFLLFSRIVTKILGGQLLRDISAFVAALDTMFGGFRERATATYELLRRPGTWFVVVATPEPDALREASYFVDRLVRRGHAAGRAGAQPHPPAGDHRAVRHAGRGRRRGGRRGRRPTGAELAAAALRVHAERMALAAREQHLADRFTSAHPEVAVRTVPAAAGDVHDLDGLRVMGAALTGPDADTPTGTPRTRVLPARRG